MPVLPGNQRRRAPGTDGPAGLLREKPAASSALGGIAAGVAAAAATEPSSVVRRTLRRVLQTTLDRIGYVVVPKRSVGVVDVRGLTEDPFAAHYLAEGKPFVIDVPLTRCRGLGVLGFPYVGGPPHPFVLSAQAVLRGSAVDPADSPLAIYYGRFQPASVAEVLGLELGCHAATRGLPPACAVLPWSGWMPSPSVAARRGRQGIAEARQHGIRLAAGDGWLEWGPVSPAKCALEFERLRAITLRMQAVGFLRHDGPHGDIDARLLVRDGDWAILIGGGQHRAAALAALGHEHLTVRIGQGSSQAAIVRREDVHYWPNVVRGIFTVDEALELFDARPVPNAASWAEEGIGR